MSDLTYHYSRIYWRALPLATGDKELVWLENEVKSPPFRLDYDAIVILDVFAKKDRTTPRHIIDRCKMRIKAYDAL